jgi:hypothetical protein
MNNLRPIAQAVQSQGRGKDTQLIHMTPNEVQGLQALAKAHGGSLSINPSTGLPEAGFLDSMLPTILGAGLAAATGGSSLMIGAGLGALQYARTGSLEKGLMAGLGAYGGAGLGSSLMGAGASGVAGSSAAQAAGAYSDAQTAVAEAAKNSALTEAQRATFQTAATDASKNLAIEQGKAAAANTFGQNLSNAGEGLKIAFKSPTDFMKTYAGSGMDLAGYAGAAASGPLMEPPEQKKREVDNVRYEYDYNANPASKEDLAQQRRDNPYGELTYFNPSYGERREVKVGAAQGGIMGLSNGGSTDTSKRPHKYSYDPATQTYKRLDEEILKTDKPVGAVESLGVNDRSGSGGDSQDTGGNYWAQREAELQAKNKGKLTQAEIEAKLRAEQVADRAKFPALLAQAAIPGVMAAKAIQSWINPPAKDYSVPWSKMTPAEKAYAVNNQAPVTDEMIREAEASDARGNAIAAAIQSGEMAKGTDVDGSAGADANTGTNEYSGPDNAAEAGYSGTAKGGLIGLARGGALRFAQAGSVPDTRIYKQPTQNAMGDEVPDQNAQKLAAAALEKQQLANQATQFVSPSAMMPQQTTFSPAAGIASGYVPNRAENYTAATPTTFQKGLTALQPARKDLPGGFGGYGDAGIVRQTPFIPNVGGTFPATPFAPAGPTLSDVDFTQLYKDADQYAAANPGKTGADYIQEAGVTNKFDQTDIDKAVSGYSSDPVFSDVNFAQLYKDADAYAAANPGKTGADYIQLAGSANRFPQANIDTAIAGYSSNPVFSDINSAQLYKDADQYAAANPGQTAADYIQLAGDINRFSQADIDKARTGYDFSTAFDGQTSPYGDMPDIGPTGISTTKEFLSTAPTAEDMVAYAQEQGMSPEQFASAWAQSTDGSFNQGLETVNQYLAANPGVKLGDGSYVAKKKGGLLGLAAGGMSRGGFVVPADVVSALGNGSTDAGLRKLMDKIGAVQPIKGKGDGLSDSIPTNIDGRQPARVADGEAYVDPRTVAKIGGGDAKKGAKKLYAMMDKIRMQAHGKKTQQRKVNDKAVV